MRTMSQEMLTESHLPSHNHCFLAHLLQSWLRLQHPQETSCCWNGSSASLATCQSECDMDIGHCCMTRVTVCRYNCAYLSAGPTGNQLLLEWQQCILDNKPVRI